MTLGDAVDKTGGANLRRHKNILRRLVMRTLTGKYFGGLALAEDIYKVDLAVLDRYQLFSSELLRLSLLGIAGYGFLIANIVLKVTAGAGQFPLFAAFLHAKFPLILGVAALGFSVGAALGHRYFSTDCITHYVRRLRLVKRCGDLHDGSLEWHKNAGIIEHEETSLDKDLKKCTRLLIVSSVCLGLGAACIAWAFAVTLY